MASALIVDDQDLVRQMLRLALESQGLEVRVAGELIRMVPSRTGGLRVADSRQVDRIRSRVRGRCRRCRGAALDGRGTPAGPLPQRA